MASLNPKHIIVDFLRNQLTDPRSRAEATNTESFVATASQTTFSLSPPAGTMSCIIDVQVNSSSQTKWETYYIDFKNQKVIFFTGLSLSDDVDIEYKYGTSNWIYPDKPVKTLSAIAFPRMRVGIISAPGLRLGESTAPVEHSINFQIDVWTKEKATNQVFTISGSNYSGEELAELFAYQITGAFEDNENDLHPVLYDYIPNQAPRDLPFDIEYQAHHKTVEFIMNMINPGRTS